MQLPTEVIIDVTNATEHSLTISIVEAKRTIISSASPLESLSFLRNRYKQSVDWSGQHLVGMTLRDVVHLEVLTGV